MKVLFVVFFACSLLLLLASHVIWWLSLMLCLDIFLFICVYLVYTFFFFYFYDCRHSIWKFLGQGLNPNCSYNLCCNCSHTRPGIEPAPLQWYNPLWSDSLFSFFVWLFFILFFNFSYDWLTVFCHFQLYSKVTHSYIFFSHYSPSCSIISD